MENQDKYTFKVHKQYLESELNEIKQNKRQRNRKIRNIFLQFLVLIYVAFTMYYFGTQSVSNESHYKKIDEIVEILDKTWLYKQDLLEQYEQKYTDFKEFLIEKMYYDLTNLQDETSSKDVYTSYLSQEELNSFMDSVNQKFVGIGIQFSNILGYSIVNEVFEDSPAQKAGLMAGDVLYKIDDTLVYGKTDIDLASLVKGYENTSVKIEIIRPSQSLKDTISLDINRAPVVAKVSSKDISSIKQDTAYIKAYTFGEETSKEFYEELNKYRNYSNIVIDLRDNGGGLLTAVVDMIGMFVGPNQVAMKTNDANNNEYEYKTSSNFDTFDNFNNIYILVNENSASASEVMALSLKEHLKDKVTIIGRTTFGKGVMQTTLLLSDGSAVKVTQGYWTSHMDTSINGIGIKPDIEAPNPLFKTSLTLWADDVDIKLDTVSGQLKDIQNCLNYLGYEIRMDGYFDTQTLNALNSFISDNNILNKSSFLTKDLYEAIIIKAYSTLALENASLNNSYLQVLKDIK